MEPPQKRHKLQENSFEITSVSKKEENTPVDCLRAQSSGSASKNNTVDKLRSCERLFGSQSLNTPQSVSASGKENRALVEKDCDFYISYSQNYSRLPSQHEDGDFDEVGPFSWNSASTTITDNEECEMKISTSSYSDPGATPEMCPEPAESSPMVRKFFPLFRPKSQWKVLHIVRHGESEFNAACVTKEGFADPQIYNPKLTAKGRRQAEKLREKLISLKISSDALWVSSPMSRALETMLLGCPLSANIGDAEKPLNIAIRKELAEQMQTTGDIGLPASIMSEQYPQFKEAFKELPERWWFEHKENDAVLKRFIKHESKKQVRIRVGELRKWLQSRPEKVIVAFGHNSLFKELTNGQKSLRNCEVHTMCI